MLYSPVSHILSIHYVVLHPFYLQEQLKIGSVLPPMLKPALFSTSGDVHDDERVEGLTDLVNEPVVVEEDPPPEGYEDS